MAKQCFIQHQGLPFLSEYTVGFIGVWEGTQPARWPKVTRGTPCHIMPCSAIKREKRGFRKVTHHLPGSGSASVYSWEVVDFLCITWFVFFLSSSLIKHFITSTHKFSCFYYSFPLPRPTGNGREPMKVKSPHQLLTTAPKSLSIPSEVSVQKLDSQGCVWLWVGRPHSSMGKSQ